MGWLRALIAVALVFESAHALVSPGEIPIVPVPSGPIAPRRAVGTASLDAASPPTATKASSYHLGRIKNETGYGSYLCAAKERYGGKLPVDATIITRVTLDAPEVVPSKGLTPTISEVIAWTASKYNISEDQLQAEDLSPQVASNDWVDNKGVRHVRLVQYYEPWEATIEYGAIIVHLEGNKAVLVTGGFISDLESRSKKEVVAASGFITQAQASAAALRAALATVPDASRAVAARLRAAAANPTAGTLVAASALPASRRVAHCDGDGQCSPTYKQVVFLPATPSVNTQELHVYVSATNGSVLAMANRLRAGEATRPKKSASGEKQDVYLSLGRGQSLYGGEVPLNTAAGTSKAGGGPYQLNDMVHGSKTFDMKNREDSDQGAAPADLLKDRDNQWGDGTLRSRQTAAVDAHWGAATTLYYYKDVHGRNGVDGRGTAIQSRVHSGKAYDNAYWYNNMMTYGSGSRDPKAFNATCTGFPPLVTLDITAHEMSHGVTEYTSGLIYEYSFGGINEALSDIMAQCVVDYAHESQDFPHEADFLCGAQMFSPSCPRPFLRSLKNPTADNNRSSGCWSPKFDETWSETHNDREMFCQVDVHWSSGVANRAFWLMAKGFNTTCNDGAKPSAIGIQNACKVFYRSTQSYLSKVADYFELRRSSTRAAEDLFGAGSKEAAAVAAAWDVVGAPRGPPSNPDAPVCEGAFATAPEKCSPSKATNATQQAAPTAAANATAAPAAASPARAVTPSKAL